MNLCASLNKTDFESGGHLKYTTRSKVGENEEALNNGVVSEPITSDRMFNILKARHPEPAGHPVMRIANQLNNLNGSIWNELGVGVRTPGGVWDWLGRNGRELRNVGRFLTNREMFDYFRGGGYSDKPYSQ